MPKHRTDETDLELLQVLGKGERKRASLPTLVSRSQRTVDRRLAKLQRYGWVTRPRFGYYALTQAGLRRLERLRSPTVPMRLDQGELKAVIDGLPTEAHRAFFRLLLSGVVAKAHLLEQVEGPWPAFLLAGRTKAFKTALGHIACRVLGLDPARHVHLLHTAVPGEFGVRRVKQKGTTKFAIEPSPLFQAPFVCLDEVDKVTDRELMRNVLFFLHGQRTFAAEGQTLVNRACPLAILNPTKAGEIPLGEAYLRRSVVLRTEPLQDELGDVDVRARRLFDRLEKLDGPLVHLDELEVGEARLNERRFGRMRELLLDHVQPDYRPMVDSKPVELLVLGRTALSQASLDEALFQTVYDRLICLETQGQAVPAWRMSVVQRWVDSGGEVDEVLKEELAEAQKRHERSRKTVIQQEEKLEAEALGQTQAQLELIGVREEALAWLGKTRQALKDLPGQRWKRETRPVREQLTHLMRRIRKAGTTAEVHQLEKMGKPMQQAANDLLREYAYEQEELDKRAEEERRAKERKREKREQIRQLEYYLRRKQVQPGENLIEILAKLGCVEVERKTYTGLELPKALRRFYPTPAHEGVLAGEKGRNLIGLGIALWGAVQESRHPEQRGRWSSEFKTTWEYLVAKGIDGQEYGMRDLDRWSKAWPLLQQKLDALKEEAD